MTPKQRRMERIRAIEREWLVASVAAGTWSNAFARDPSALVAERLEYADYLNFSDNRVVTQGS